MTLLLPKKSLSLGWKSAEITAPAIKHDPKNPITVLGKPKRIYFANILTVKIHIFNPVVK